MSRALSLQNLASLTLECHFLTSKPPTATVTEVVDRICGLNAQSARAPYLSLWNRMEGFDRESLDTALYKEKTLIKAWLMRGTVHIVPTADFPVYQKALGESLSSGWEASLERQTLVDLPPSWTRLLDAVLKSLAEGPLAKSDLVARVGSLIKHYEEAEQKRLVGWALRLLTYRGLVCHAQPTGPWYHFKDNRFALVSAWLDPVRLDKTDREEALQQLLIKYLLGYGPATVHDFAYWTGLRMPEARKAFAAAGDRLSRVSIKASKAAYWMPAGGPVSLDAAATTRPVCFLPEFDSLIMGHKDKSRLTDEENRKKVFLALARVVPALLIDGRLAGTWEYHFTDRSLAVKPFAALPKETRNSIQAASKHLKQFLAD